MGDASVCVQAQGLSQPHRGPQQSPGRVRLAIILKGVAENQ